MRTKRGRPKRKDNPRKLTLILSETALRALDRLSSKAPSRGWVVENLIMEAVAK